MEIHGFGWIIPNIRFGCVLVVWGRSMTIASTVLIREHKIDFLLNTGIAGTLDPSLNLTDVCYGKRLIQHDYGTLKEEQIEVYPAGSIPLGDSGNLLSLLKIGWLDYWKRRCGVKGCLC